MAVRDRVNRGVGWFIANERHDWWKPILKAHKKGKLCMESDTHCILGVNGFDYNHLSLCLDRAEELGFIVSGFYTKKDKKLYKEWIRAAKKAREKSNF